jgi:hypothetical protein
MGYRQTQTWSDTLVPVHRRHNASRATEKGEVRPRTGSRGADPLELLYRF